MRIAKEDTEKTICIMEYEAFEFLMMPFMLTNASVTFCTLMNQVFWDFLDKFIVVYLDNIVIFSSTLKECIEHIKLVFQRLSRKLTVYEKGEMCFC